MKLEPKYRFENGTGIAFGNQNLVLHAMNEQGYEFADSETGEVSVTSFSKFAKLLQSRQMRVTDTSGLASSVVELRLGSLKIAEQLAAPQRENGEFHFAICSAAAALRTHLRHERGNPSLQMTEPLLNLAGNRQFICNLASDIFGKKVRLSPARGGNNSDWVLYKGRTLLKYLKLFDALGVDEDAIAALSTREHLKGNRIPRIDIKLLELMTRAWEEIGLDLKCTAPANVHRHLTTLVHELNKIRKTNELRPLIVPSQKTLKAHRDNLLSPTEYLVATKGEKHARNKRGRGSTDFRALMPGELVEIDECKLSTVSSAKEIGLWASLTDKQKQRLEEIDKEIRDRLTLLVMIDVASRMPLAWILSDQPKAEATLALLRMATRDKTKEKIKFGCSGNPAPAMGLGNIKSDNGTGLRNEAVISSAVGVGSAYTAVKTYSPIDKTYVERVFGTCESVLIKLLHGYTGRKAGELPGYDAKANGVLSTEELYDILTRFFIDEYPSMRHHGVGMGGRRPVEVLKELNNTRGLFRPICEDLRRRHLGWKREVKPNDEGVRVFGGIYYNSDEFQREIDKHPKERVSVFVDPDDVSEATVTIPGVEQVFRLPLQVTAFRDMTLPEVLDLVQAYRREHPNVTEIHEDRLATVRRERHTQLLQIGVENKLPRSYSTFEEVIAKADVVFAGSRVVPNPEPTGSVRPGEIGPGVSGPGVLSLREAAQDQGNPDDHPTSASPEVSRAEAEVPRPVVTDDRSSDDARNPKRSVPNKHRPLGRPKTKGSFK
ncbi:integrase-like protein [Aliiruegeria haliotis]|uniref:Integrase-like protein n=1 Tax=Aliiruegeria haliotis TaxID=1280846 RepID=A0A2T0RI41_9RHOB|nr:DDE-type integrase/transposase/recombinase [Aliiruegeria haliotis]PRY20853.1 integrase-like protein [Aliiruegeria haliotis]